jgi:hypothetical protein
MLRILFGRREGLLTVFRMLSVFTMFGTTMCYGKPDFPLG